MANSSCRFVAGMLLCACSATAFSAIPDGYYSNLEGKSGVQLKKAVKAAAQNHTAISYGDETWEVFFESDTHMVGNQRCWWDMYSNNNVAAPKSSSHGGLNIEHSVANSWWGGTKNDAYKDIHHLNPSDATANNRKSNYPLGIVKTETWSNGVTIVGKPAGGTCGGAPYVYEPCDEYKGDFARVFFYMFTIYDNISWSNQSDRNFMYNSSSDLLLQPWAYEMLLEWSRNDPVSQKEIDRNNVVYRHQKNRNPFIDYPQLAEHIWGSKSSVPFHADGSEDPGTEPDQPDYPDVPDTPDLPSGFWYAVTSASQLNEEDSYVVVATVARCAMSHENPGKYQNVCGAMPVEDKGVTPARLSSVPSDAAVLRLSRNGSGWLVSVTDLAGTQKGYMNCTSAKTLTLVSSPSGNGTTATITPSSDHTTIQFAQGSGSLQYNPAAPRFLTYTSQQEPVMLYRFEEQQSSGMATGAAETAEEVIYGIYDINGRKVAAESVSDLERGIYIVVSNFGTKKILK